MSVNDRGTTHSTHQAESNKGDQRERKVGDYTIIQKIGQGSFATVYKAQHKTTGRVVAIKSVLRSKLTRKLLENLESEISILKAIRHDHIVGLIECQKTDTHIHLIMEYCSMGDLSQYIKRKRANKSSRTGSGAVPERILRHFLKQLASALKFMRSHNLVHRDIKPQNLLLIPPEESTLKDGSDMPLLKLADFGFARFLPNASLADTLCGSPLYMGPEILAYEKYDAKADLWSVGAVLYEMATGRPPFRAQNHIELLKKIQENGDKIRFPDERPLSEDASRTDVPTIGNDIKDLIRKLLKKNPVERISFEEFFIHPAVVQDTQITPSPTKTHSSSIRPKLFTAPASLPIMKTTRGPTSDYEPPPFAQSPSTPRQTFESRPLTSADRFRVAPQRRLQSESNVPFHEREHEHGNSGWTQNDTHDPGTMMIKRNRRGGTETEEDVLHEYVVLDRRIIETNQFADEVSASPRTETMDRAYKGQIAIPRGGSNDLPSPSPPSLGTTPPFSMPRERKISTGSAGSALARALSLASVRLFGAGNSPPKFGKYQHQEAGSPRGFMITDGRAELEDNQAIKDIERMACMAHAVARYADTKFDQLIGSRSGNELVLAEETMVLHIKVLALLEQGLEIAKNYWNQITDENLRAAPIRLNDSVQWMRDRFNESLERASFAGSKCERDDPNGLGVCVEKLLYDRALEMSRAAAVQELVGENLSGCEHEYQAAIWMLEAILVAPGDDDVVIEEDDHRIINKFIGSIKHRISVLRKKRDELESRAQDLST